MLIGISVWLPQLPMMGPGMPGVDYTAMVEGATHQTAQHGGARDAATVTAADTIHPPTVVAEAKAEEVGPVNGERLTSLSLLVISGSLLVAMLSAARTSLGKGLGQLVGLRLASAQRRLGQRFLSVQLGVFLI